jgi:hypothetical protein
VDFLLCDWEGRFWAVPIEGETESTSSGGLAAPRPRDPTVDMFFLCSYNSSSGQAEGGSPSKAAPVDF